MTRFKFAALIVVSIVLAVLLATALSSFTRISDSALADVATPGASVGAGSSRPSTAGTNYLPIIFLNSATAGGAWLLAGNGGTNWTTDFLGTTDNMTLTFRVSNTIAYRLVPAVDPFSGWAPNLIGGAPANSITPGLYGATIAGGGSSFYPNVINGNGGYATIGGGSFNNASSTNATVSGGYANTAGGAYAIVAGGYANTAGITYTTVGGGYGNAANGLIATIAGGSSNNASGAAATIGGGEANYVSGNWAAVGGGALNTVSGITATIAGGQYNLVQAAGAMIGAGYSNTINPTGTFAFIGGGQKNTASNFGAAIGGGVLNSAGGDSSTVGGGFFNYATGLNATVGGGVGNQASGSAGTVGGGRSNYAIGTDYSTVGGGYSNLATGAIATIGGGSSNNAGGPAATIGGGESNSANGYWATVGGGLFNHAIMTYTTASGGYSNTVTAYLATIGGGFENTASGAGATVPGGSLNAAGGDYSFAAGCHAKANHTGAFAWADSSCTDFASTAPNQFIIRANGGVGINTNTPTRTLEVNGKLRVDDLSNGISNVLLCFTPAGDITACSSSRRFKNNITDLTLGLDALAKLRPVTFNWNETGEADLGFIAEEVNQVSPLLTTLNKEGQLQGVKYNVISAVLVKGMQEQQAQITGLQSEVASLRSEKAQQQNDLNEVKARLAALEQNAPLNALSLNALAPWGVVGLVAVWAMRRGRRTEDGA